jgi:hypothetical protein
MQKLQALKFVNATPPAAIVDNGAFTANAIDTKDYDEAVLVASLGATDIALAALKLQECDTEGGTYEDVAGADFSVSPLALPGAGDDSKLVGVFVDLIGRKRYLKLAATAGDGTAGTYLSVLAILGRAKQAPDTAADRGLVAQAIV